MRQRERLEALRLWVEADDGVGAEVGEPDLVALVDVDGVGLRPRAGQLPGTPGAARRVVDADLAAIPLAHPDAAAGVRPDATGAIQVFDAPRGRGPYGIATTPAGDVYYASLAGSYVGRIDLATGAATVLEPPTANQGARRVWPDSRGRVWVSEWNSGQVSVYDPSSGTWRAWKLPGARPQAYAVYVDERDKVWLTDFGANTIVRFDPETERFESFALPSPNASVRQLLGRPGEVWGAESAADQLVVIRF